MNVEDTLRDVLQAEARHTSLPEPSAATWRAIERRAARRRTARWAGTSALAAAAAVLVAVLVVGGGDSSPTRVEVVPADPTTTTAPTTTTTRVPSRLDALTVFTIGSDDPLETARRFGLDYLGMTTPVVEPASVLEAQTFVGLRPRAGHPMLTSITLERDADGSYVVIGAETRNITVERPEPGDQLGTTVRVAGTSTAFEATVRVEIRQRDGRVLGGGIVMGGSNGEFAIFTGDFTFDAPTTDTGAVVFFTDSAEDGSVQEATVIPVTFVRSQ
jgi:hypothetical protein